MTGALLLWHRVQLPVQAHLQFPLAGSKHWVGFLARRAAPAGDLIVLPFSGDPVPQQLQFIVAEDAEHRGAVALDQSPEPAVGRVLMAVYPTPLLQCVEQ